jgi:hypothetical protein
VNSWTVAAPAGSTAVVRVVGFNGGSIENLGFSAEGISAQNVLLYFPDTFSIVFSNVGLEPSILAPQAGLTFLNTWMGGKVIGRYLWDGGSFGTGTWNGDLSGCTTDFVPPVPVGCSYDWNVVNSWGSGAQVQVDMTWHLPPTNGWEASWDFDHAETVTSAWNASVSQTPNSSGNDSTVVATDAGWNVYLNTDSSVSFGMIVDTPYNTASEYLFTLNGVNCMPLP